MSLLRRPFLIFGMGLFLMACRGESETPPTAAPDVDLLIRGAVVMTMDDALTVFDPGYLAVKGGEIVEVGEDTAELDLTAARVIDADGGYLLPGLVNGHQHAPMSVFRGMGDDLDLMDWLQQYIFPAEKKNVDEEMVYWGTLWSVAEMVRSGTTTYADMYYFEGKVAEATSLAGMRGVLGETILDFPTPDSPDPQAGLAFARRFIEKWKDDPLIVPAVAPHAPFTCSKETLLAAKQLADELDVPILIHVAETEDEVRQIREKTGTTPVRYLDQIGFLADRVVAAHGVHVDAEEIAILKRTGVGVIHNPESNMKLASGVAPIPSLLAAGVDVGIGTDGPASNNNLDLLQEIDTMAKLHKLSSGDPTVLNARTALTIATRGGARVLGLESLIGSLEEGKRADLLLLSAKGTEAVPSYDPFSTVVYALTRESVEWVMVNGRVIFEDGRMTTFDEDEVRRRVIALAEKVRASLRE